jgi:aspartyl-tRNA(Asn)/glutamyl-tRNA(Gln) amidotransferase subunit A
MAESGSLVRSLSDIAAQIRRRELAPVEVTRAVLDRLEHLNPRLNAVLTNLGEQVLEAAKRAEQDLVAGQPRGPLHGVPLALKDICALRGVQVTAGSRVLDPWIADYDATVVARLKAAGVIFIDRKRSGAARWGSTGILLRRARRQRAAGCGGGYPAAQVARGGGLGGLMAISPASTYAICDFTG